MGPPDSSFSQDDGDAFRRLKSAVERLSRGDAADEVFGDPELDRALHRLAQAAVRPPAPSDALAGSSTLAHGVRHETTHLVLLRVDRFRSLQARLGERTAIGLLAALRDRVRLRSSTARLGRLGAGVVEFVFEPGRDEAVCEALAVLQAALEQPVFLDDETITPRLTIGAARLGTGLTFAEGLNQAEQALARAEASGEKLALFCERSRAEASERSALLRDLRDGLEAGQFSLAYQPKLNLRTGRIDSLEALARWRHPVRGVVSPDQFVALAEDTGDIGRLTEQVLELAIRDQTALAAQGRPLNVYINLSGRLVADETFCRWVQGMCASAAGRIGLEITETAVIADPERALRNLNALAEAGIGIAIDDYGSGLSSLAYMKALPAKELKIDRAFVHGLSSSHRDPLIVRSTIDLAHALQMEVTAEGVDDPTAFALLRVMGCDRVQGYLIAPPLELPALLAFLDAQDGPEAIALSGGGALMSLRR